MGVLTASAEDYYGLLRRLLPRGPFWVRDDSDAWNQMLRGLAEEFARLHEAAALLVEEADPRTASAMLDAWERLAGLPDPCIGSPLTLDARRRLLHARVTATGGQSPAYFIEVAERLGYEITIESAPYNAFQVDVSTAETPLYDHSWEHVWRVNVRWHATPQVPLECTINRLKPAHTFVEFVYDDDEE